MSIATSNDPTFLRSLSQLQPPRRLRAAPLLDELHVRGVTIGRQRRSLWHNVNRAAQSGTVTPYVGHQLATRLLDEGPASLWGDAWRVATTPPRPAPPSNRQGPTRITAGPLVTAVRARGLRVGWYPQAIERAYCRALRRGTVTLDAAEQLAHALLAEHPATLWGDVWWEKQNQTS